MIDGKTFENVTAGINREGWADSVLSISNNTFQNSSSGISMGNPASGATTGITDNSFTNVDTDFNLQNLTTAISFDLEATGNVATDSVVVLGSQGNDVIVGSIGNDTGAGFGLGFVRLVCLWTARLYR